MIEMPSNEEGHNKGSGGDPNANLAMLRWSRFFEA
jgi:hypothetical protein